MVPRRTQHCLVPEELGDLLPTQYRSPRLSGEAALGAAVLIDALHCLKLPPDTGPYRDAIRWLLGPSQGERITFELACGLAGVEADSLRERLRAAGHTTADAPPPWLRVPKHRIAG